MPYCVEQSCLNAVERNNLRKFLLDHRLYCENVKSHYSITFQSMAGIGINIDVTCTLCNHKHDITDVGSW